MPAILVECGFIDHKTDAAMLATNEGRAKFANGIVKGTLSFIGIAEKPSTQEYVTPYEAIDILVEKGIITEPAKWYEGTWKDEDFK